MTAMNSETMYMRPKNRFHGTLALFLASFFYAVIFGVIYYTKYYTIPKREEINEWLKKKYRREEQTEMTSLSK